MARLDAVDEHACQVQNLLCLLLRERYCVDCLGPEVLQTLSQRYRWREPEDTLLGNVCLVGCTVGGVFMGGKQAWKSTPPLAFERHRA